MASKLRNDSRLFFVDISSERFRVYHYPGVQPITIDNPQWLHVSPSGGHRILDAEGFSHYMAPGWVHLFWYAKPGAPHFVQ